MAGKGGAMPGAGRPKGSLNAKTQALVARIAADSFLIRLIMFPFLVLSIVLR